MSIGQMYKIMKRIIVIVIFLMAQVAVVAQEKETRKLGSFSAIKAAEGIDVILRKGTGEQAEIHATGTDTENVLTEVSGGYLKIHMADGRYRDARIKVYVTYVNVNKLSASSAANIYSDSPIKSSKMDISASSAGNIDVEVESTTIYISASSAADVEVRGKTKMLNADASSAGEIDAYDLEADEVRASASSGASIKVLANQEIDAEASSGGSVRYRGNPSKSNTNSSSGGSVKRSS